MLLKIFCLSLFWGSLIAQIPLENNGSLVTFPISPNLRGEDIVSMIGTLSSPPYKTALSQVAIQTTRNGLLVNPIKLTLTTNKTILIIDYVPTSSTQPLYIAVPVEQISEIVYSIRPIPSSNTYTSVIPSNTGILPIFSVALPARSQDLQNAFNILNTQKPYKTSNSTVSLQTTISGSFDGTISGGVIPQVQSIQLTAAPNGTLLLITYKIGVTSNYTIIVSPDQVYGIIYNS